ncbi:LPXTG cell wall anchor domain-containing protein [Kitasatospora sp. NPDC058048]|uniref:DUF7927 domain-containing protein n=1 Tax=Kitasatospora sp. NPDC058048 TaxID=3346313 RepID=UPI0036DA3373
MLASSVPFAVHAAAAPPAKAGTSGAQRPIGPKPALDLLAHGNLTMASNSVVSCDPEDSDCDLNAYNNNRVNWVKTDPKAPGNTASAATLTVPPGAKVLNARLYWQANPVGTSRLSTSGDASKADQVEFKVPGATGYQRLTADTYDWFDQKTGGTPPAPLTAHAGVKDVTDLVRAAGSGEYTVADIQACQGRSSTSDFGGQNVGCWGGWSLVVAYEDAKEPLRYLQVWDGYQLIRPPEPSITMTLDGIRTPAGRAPAATMGVIVGDGDAPIAGDSLEVGPDAGRLTPLLMPTATGPAPDNAFTSRIDRVAPDGTGTNLTDRNPNTVNNVGYDARMIDVTGKLPAGSKQAVLRVTGQGDALHPQAVWLAVEALEPDLQIVKANTPAGSTTNSPPGLVDPGAEITYTFTVANRHPDGTTADLDTATGVTLTDVLPQGTSYVDGSGTGCTASGRNVTCPTADLAPGAETTVSFRARVDAGLAPGTRLDDTASLAYRGTQTGREQHRTSNTVRNTVTEHTGYRVTKTADRSQAAPGDTVTYHVDVTNTGNTPLTALTVTDDLSAVLDDATYNGDATATLGTPSYTQPVLTWTGDLPAGGNARLTYTVKVKDPAAGDHTLRNTAVADRPGGNCPPGATAGECTATVTVTTSSPTPTASPTTSPSTTPTSAPSPTATDGNGVDPAPTGKPQQPSGGGGLAATGSQVALIGGIGAAVLLGGAALVLASRRRRHRH